MNNYSLLQMFLHKLVLSSQFMREVMFDIEKFLFLDENYESKDCHVFVAGLSRSGTTVLLNAIYQSNKFASLSYSDMPFILAPNLWSKVNFSNNHLNSRKRAHGDSIKISINSPEAFEEIFWKTFKRSDFNLEEYIKNYISLILKKNQKFRYLSKNNQNIRRLVDINKYFPKSKILVPFRDPLQHSYSLLTQHKRFSLEQKKDPFILNYMNWIGHSEFGLGYKPISSFNLKYEDDKKLNHWLEQWYLTYKDVLELPLKQKAFYLIHYESLCNSPIVWAEVKRLLGLDKNLQFSFQASSKGIQEPYDDQLLSKANQLYKELQKNYFNISNQPGIN